MHRAIALVAVLMMTGCATVRQTDPPTTATEQLLISTAVDRSVGKLKLSIPPGSRVYLDAQNLDSEKEYVRYPKYTIAAVRDQLMRLGYKVVDQRSQADVSVELRSGAQSINEKSILIGTPNIAVPVPFAGSFAIPELALFKYHRLRGISKLALSASNAAGSLLYSTEFQYGEAEQKHWVFLFVITHTSHDLWPGE
jgi:hypothetical protein